MKKKNRGNILLHRYEADSNTCIVGRIIIDTFQAGTAVSVMRLVRVSLDRGSGGNLVLSTAIFRPNRAGRFCRAAGGTKFLPKDTKDIERIKSLYEEGYTGICDLGKHCLL